MNKVIGLALLVIGIAIGWQLDMHLSVVEKVNIAFPPRPEVRIQLETMTSLIPSDDPSLVSFKSAYESKLTLRALTCTQATPISRFDSVNNIKTQAIDRDCLKEQDDQLLALIGIKIVGLRLAQPPLRPLVKLGPPTVIHGAENAETYTGKSASQAGVVVLRGTRSEFTAVEIPSGKKIASLPTIPEASHTNYAVSPNGRVLAITVNNRDLRFIDNETGQDLWLARDVGQLYAWLPEMQAVLVQDNKSGPGNGGVVLIDFKTGTSKPYEVPLKNQSWALHLSASPSRLLIGSYKEFSLIENTRTAEGVNASVVREFRIKSPFASVSSLTPTAMLNGQAIVFVTGRDFMLFNLETREERLWESHEVIGNNYAKWSEESILVDGFGQPNTGTTQPFIFNVKDATLSPVETAEGNQGIIYELNGRTGFMRRSHQKVWVGDELQTGKPESLDDMITGRKLERQLQALEQEERLSKARLEALKAGQDINRAPRPMYPYGTSTMPQDMLIRRQLERGYYPNTVRMSPAAEAPAAEAPAMPPPPMPSPLIQSSPIQSYSAASNELRRQAITTTTSRMLGAIPSNARVEAVGVYEAKDRSSSGVNVMIKKSDQPIVLMLSAYEPVRWNLTKEPGANLVAVIASGYHLPEVTGAGAAKTVIKRGEYAYQQNGAGYAALNNEAMLWTGKPISKFQGIYGGTVFIVGN
ncbi:PQQ-binding-like beta-propeller repeat protein [Methylophilus sp. 5]|uniref:PQQ-binding-like beta-propeller repeat protein n=1 Tax=Methylophilus sp. 5 TaxID=1112274 RepID=UPI00048B1FB1|nr:PQQ-binding-like beta-propeller repeat protein [Methylophilus sp. 5]